MAALPFLPERGASESAASRDHDANIQLSPSSGLDVTSVRLDMALQLLCLLIYNTSLICNSFFSAFPRLLFCVFSILRTAFGYRFPHSFIVLLLDCCESDIRGQWVTGDWAIRRSARYQFEYCAMWKGEWSLESESGR